MDHGKQQFFRFLFPGLAAAIGISALLANKPPKDFLTSFELSFKSIGAPFVLALLIGGLYWSFLASRFRKWIFKRTGNRIIQRMSEYAETRGIEVLDPTLTSFRDCIRDQWYRIIDSDKQLTTKSEAIRLNGTVATSAIETVIVVTVFLVLFFFFGPVSGWGQWLALFVVLWVLALILFVGARVNHVRLVDEQISVAERNLGDEVREAVQTCSKSR